MAEPESGPGRMAEPLEIVAAVEALLGGAAPRSVPLVKPHGPGRSPASASSSPPGRRTSRSTRCATSPTARRASRATPSRGRPRRPAPRSRWCPARSPSPIRPASRWSHVETARDMLAAVEAALPADIAVFAAAVADWRVAAPAQEDQESRRRAGPGAGREPRHPRHGRAPRRRRPGLVVGFAAETENVVENARAKLARKGCDLIVANDVSPRTRRHGRRPTTPCISSPRTASRPGRPSTRTRWRAA